LEPCFFASTSASYIEKSNATLLASVADLHEGEELVNYFWKFRPAS
jgi:hypothetical protein